MRKKEFLEFLTITVYAIHGTMIRGCRPLKDIKRRYGIVVYWEEEYPSLLLAKDGEMLDLDGKQASVMGGAYSVDKMV